jgi:hypothetical protein
MPTHKTFGMAALKSELNKIDNLTNGKTGKALENFATEKFAEKYMGLSKVGAKKFARNVIKEQKEQDMQILHKIQREQRIKAAQAKRKKIDETRAAKARQIKLVNELVRKKKEEAKILEQRERDRANRLIEEMKKMVL